MKSILECKPVNLRKLLPVLVIGITLLTACSARAGTAPAVYPTASPPASASSATAAPASTATSLPTATQVPVPPALPVAASPALVRIDFQDAHDGWGIAVNANGSVLRTIDGGSSWYNATPASAGPIGFSTVLNILDTNHVWVLVPGTDFFSGTLYRTSDGGISWSSNTVPFGGAFMQFQEGGSGRALADRGAGAGSEAVELFQTSDGGDTWTSVFHDDPGLPGSSDSLPLAGIKNGMSFRDDQTGWVTGSVPVDGEVYLYVTHDGGVSWSQQSLPLPAGYEKYQYLAQAPIFFGKVGFLPLTIYRSGATDLTFFTSQDGGQTWTGNPANPAAVIEPCLPAIADARQLWCWDGGSNLYSSSDGAQTWTASNPGLNLSGNLSRFEFVPGYAGWALTRLDETEHSQLYRTTNGANWTPLIH
jgi:photosystem II stability/assembly factor-like uncharacterized protein